MRRIRIKNQNRFVAQGILAILAITFLSLGYVAFAPLQDYAGSAWTGGTACTENKFGILTGFTNCVSSGSGTYVCGAPSEIKKCIRDEGSILQVSPCVNGVCSLPARIIVEQNSGLQNVAGTLKSRFDKWTIKLRIKGFTGTITNGGSVPAGGTPTELRINNNLIPCTQVGSDYECIFTYDYRNGFPGFIGALATQPIPVEPKLYNDVSYIEPVAGSHILAIQLKQGTQVVASAASSLSVVPFISKKVEYHFDDISATQFATDSSGNSKHGLCTGAACPARVRGKWLSGLDFDGLDDGVSFPQTDFFGNTFSFWMKPQG